MMGDGCVHGGWHGQEQWSFCVRPGGLQRGPRRVPKHLRQVALVQVITRVAGFRRGWRRCRRVGGAPATVVVISVPASGIGAFGLTTSSWVSASTLFRGAGLEDNSLAQQTRGTRSLTRPGSRCRFQIERPRRRTAARVELAARPAKCSMSTYVAPRLGNLGLDDWRRVSHAHGCFC